MSQEYYSVEKESNLDYTLNLKVTNNGNNLTNYTLLNSNKQPVSSETTIKDLVGQEFYISIPDTTDLSLVRLTVEGTYYGTVITYWTVGGSEDSEQPIAVLEKGENNFEDWTEVVYKQTEGKALDLSLRKFIIKVNDKEIATNGKFIREPNVDISPLFNKTSTTASYRHNKAPILVEIGDIVTYTIRVYNEGDIDGYVREITDYLPAQLEYLPDDKLNKQYGWQVVNNGRALKTDITSPDTEYAADQEALYGSRENKTLLKAYGGKTNDQLDYIEVQVRCKVIDTGFRGIITNIAEITAFSDGDGNSTTDRDSFKQNLNLPSDENLPNYRGNTSNKEDLSDSNYHYKGQEDDDDFEKLVIKPVEKIFDLALFKHIAAVSKDENIESGEYITDTKNINGTYLRAPVVTAIDAQTGKITYKEDNKEALVVNPGDYVLYTIRVYNEGEVNGYASKIKDTLPIGLEFVVGNEEYNGIWNLEGLDADGKQIVSTTWYAKGQGAELNSQPGDTNYKANLLKALNKEGAISNTKPANPDYLDAQILCRVTENATSDRILVNNAQISDDSDENGNPIDDIDSTPDKWIDGEDDQDIERIKVRTDGKYNVVLIKEDKDGKQLNSTAKFEVTKNGIKEEKEITGRLTIAENVPVDADHLEDDIYVIKETKAPDEYCEFDGTITITVSKKEKADGSGYETSMKYTVVDSKGNDITGKKDANVYLNEDGNIYVEVKNYKDPEIHKGVKDIKNQDSGYNADEIHSWVIESDIPKNIEEYKFYNIVDDIDYRLKFEGINNVTVKIGNTKLAEGTDYKIAYTENATGVQDKTKSGTLTLTFIDTDNSMNTSDKIKNNAGEKIQVTFKTSFAKDENGNLLAAMGEQVENQAKLEYKNSSSDNKVVKESEKPEVHTGGVTLYKYYVANGEKVSLAGAKFGIYANEEDAKNNKNVIATAISDEKGIVKFIGLKYGGDANSDKNNLTNSGTYEYDADKASTKYWIAEIEAPAGYQKNSGVIEVIINKDSYNEKEIKYEVENDKLNFDLALRKFITEVQTKEVTSRIPQVKIENKKVTYEHSKDPLTVHVDDKIIYTIRVYNEGNIDGYASEITDDIPEYLEYLPDENTNVQYMWKMYDKDGNETTNVDEAVKVKTTYLSKDNGKDKLLKAFDGTTLNYQDVKIAFKVKDPKSNTTIITNHAQISDDSDKDGKPIEDIDSKPDEWNEGEDDQDIENVKVEYFDLSLLKFVSKVIVVEDGKENVTNTGYNGHEEPEPVVKVELHKKKLKDVVVKFGYGITITNEGDIPGYATEITDYIPEGLRFETADNPQWTDEGNNVISTRQLENTLLQPGESKTVEVILTWINGADNLALKTNTAEISEDKNEYDVPDRDSIPDNRKDGEDDIDIAKVILAVTTGVAKTYFTLTIGLLSIVFVGVVLIKKFVI